MDRAHTYLQMLGDVRTRLFVIADSGDNDSARVGALREAAKCIAREIQLSQSLGLIPARVDDGAVSEDVRWLVQQLAQLLRRHRVPPAVIDEAGPKWVGSAASLEEITVHLLTAFIDGHLAVVRIRRQPIFPLYVP